MIKRTPPNLLKEVILVDDCSDLKELESLKRELEEKLDLESSNKVQIIRNKDREGLIRSRVYGARKAIGDVLVFLDSHIEVNQEWMEPLLHLIKVNRSAIAVPIIDIINADTFAYTPSPLVRGGFNWGLHYRWDNIPKSFLKTEDDFKGPFASPTMAGGKKFYLFEVLFNLKLTFEGLFAIDRKYFRDMGEYDMGMVRKPETSANLSFS